MVAQSVLLWSKGPLTSSMFIQMQLLLDSNVIHSSSYHHTLNQLLSASTTRRPQQSLCSCCFAERKSQQVRRQVFSHFYCRFPVLHRLDSVFRSQMPFSISCIMGPLLRLPVLLGNFANSLCCFQSPPSLFSGYSIRIFLIIEQCY